MKRLIFMLLLGMFFLPVSNAQLWKYKRYQASVYAGTSQFFGDVGDYSNGENVIGLKDLTLRQTRFSVGISAKYWVVEEATIKAGVSFTSLHGTDVRGSNSERGFISTTSVIEPTIGGEYYFVRNKVRNRYFFMQGGGSGLPFRSFFDVYASLGIGAAIFDVTPNEVLESKMQKDAGVALTLPVGAGVNLVMSPKVSIGTEILFHCVLSDYLDGYTSQYSSGNDLFYTVGFSVVYKFRLTEPKPSSGVRR